VEAALKHADRRTNMKLICAFCDYLNAPAHCLEGHGVEGKNIKLEFKERVREDVNRILVVHGGD
jgi:hypothetical protein